MKYASPLLWPSLYPQFLQCLYKLMNFSSIIVLCIYVSTHILTYVCVWTYWALLISTCIEDWSLEIGQPMWEFDPGADGYSISQQALTSCSFLGEAYGFSSAWIVMWTGVVIVLISQATILLRVHGYSFSVISRRYYLTVGLAFSLTLEIFLPSLWFSLSPRYRYCLQCIN